MGRWRSPRRGHHHILGGGIAHISPLCYTESEIPAALRATRHTAAFRTQFRCEKEGERIRAAKRHIEPDTARHPAARISKPYPRKGTETQAANPTFTAAVISKPYPRKGTETDARRQEHAHRRISKPYPRKGTETVSEELGHHRAEITISKPYPRKGTETTPWQTASSAKSSFQNHIPARGRKL